MDNFTLAVVVGDALVVLVLVALIVIDKGKPATPASETLRPSGKR